MKTIDIQAFEDRSRPAGGHAVVLLTGVTAISRSAVFVLRPLDGTLDVTDTDWPRGETAPVETRLTDAGVELVIGPGFVDNPLLLPGTPVSIDLPNEGIRGEFLWPSVAMPHRPRRRSLQPALAAPVSISAPVSAPVSVKAASPEPVSNRSRSAPVREDTEMSDATRDGPRNGRRTVSSEPPRTDDRTGDDDVPFYASARAGSPRAAAEVASRGVALPTSRGGVAAAAIIATLAVQALAYTLMSARSPADPPREQANKARPAETAIYDALSAGDTAPSGLKITGVSTARMLELANASLFADASARNTQEAAFWLKRYLIATTGDDRARRAMTQLGTTFAAPSRGAADYKSARQVWEIAAAHGDPVAMCFIAKLFDAGLDGPVDRIAAERWTELARPHGGCGNP